MRREMRPASLPDEDCDDRLPEEDCAGIHEDLLSSWFVGVHQCIGKQKTYRLCIGDPDGLRGHPKILVYDYDYTVPGTKKKYISVLIENPSPETPEDILKWIERNKTTLLDFWDGKIDGKEMCESIIKEE